MKRLSDTFPIRNGAKQDALLPFIFNAALKYVLGRSSKCSNCMENICCCLHWL